MRPRLLLATHNAGKVQEYRSLLQGLPYRLVGLEDVGIMVKVAEEGDSFEENARVKALAYARLSGLLTLADDSGLEVDVLGGEPGCRSARYAGEQASDEANRALLLERLMDVPRASRLARFRCVIALAGPEGYVEMCESECRGVIAFESRGTGGFGYDPIFYVPELGKTMAEMSFEEKNTISHRGRAAQGARALLQELYAAGSAPGC